MSYDRKMTEKTWASAMLFLTLLLTPLSAGMAEVTLDGTFGTSGPLNGPNYSITANMGQQAGSNLFHSFGKFNLTSTESATFSGPNSVENIISRVTGGNPSNINGLMSSTIPGANLYFINPSGIVFGPDAQLDINGSFYASTADYIKLGDSGRFDALNPANSILTSAPPSAFGFLSASPKNITLNNSFLKVNAGETISLIGGDITISNSDLYAPSGAINLISLASSGEASVSDSGIIVDSFRSLGTINISDSRLNSERPVSDYNPDYLIGNLDVSGPGGGKIFIRGGKFVIDNGWVLADTFGNVDAKGIDIKMRDEILISNNSYLTSETIGKGSAGYVLIDTPRMTIDYSSIFTNTSGDGNAGFIRLEVADLSLSNGAKIKSDSRGSGTGGAIEITASNSISSSYSHISTEAFSTGDGGYISIKTPTLDLDNFTLITANTFGAGDGGHVEVHAGKISLQNGSQINTLSRGTGDGGGLSITASESINVSGYYTNTQGTKYYSGFYGDTDNLGEGGFIHITTPSLLLDNGRISTTAWGDGNAGFIWLEVADLSLNNGAKIKSDSRGSGVGGLIAITATNSISLSDSHISTEAFSTGAGGYISIKTPTLDMDNFTLITANTFGDGDGGYVKVEAGTISLQNGSQINTLSRGSGNGGGLSINASESITVSGYYTNDQGTKYYSGFYGDTDNIGEGGFIHITTPSLLLNNGRISTTAWGNGNAGYIRLDVTDLTLLNGSRIQSNSSGLGYGGLVQIEAAGTVLVSGASIKTEGFSTGESGFISINASALELNNGAISTTAWGDGNAGLINLEIGSLRLSQGSFITSDTYGAGYAGLINIEASDSMSLSGSSYISTGTDLSGEGGLVGIKTPLLEMDSFSLITANTYGSGQGGYILIDAGKINLKNGSQINSFSRGSGNAGAVMIIASDSIEIEGLYETGGYIYHSGFYCSSFSTGDGGFIYLSTPLLSMNGGRISVATRMSGSGGDILIEAGTINLSESAMITSSSIGDGNAGNIGILSDIITIDESMINTSSIRSAGGNINISTGDLHLTNNSSITASVRRGEGGGGNVTITATAFAALENSDITARADQGYGGDITINSQAVLFSKDSELNASSNVVGREGMVEVNAPVLDISGKLTDLPETFFTAESFLPKRCAEKEEDVSNLIVKGRDGIPVQPDSLLPSP